MVALPPIARLVYIALWCAADDHGYLRDEPERLAMELFPREDLATFDAWFQFFIVSGRLEQYGTDDGASYMRIARWEQHQRVDKPSKSRISREGSRKLAIPHEARRQLATKYGCPPGGEAEAQCYYCQAPGNIKWWTIRDGRPSAWVSFSALEIDHLDAENSGGETVSANLILACRHCNRTKGTKHWLDMLCAVNGIKNTVKFPGTLARIRDGSTQEQGTGNREREEGAPTAPRSKDPVFGAGVELLTSRGDSEKNARTFLGKLVSEWHERDVSDAITAAFSAKGDPKGYIRKVLESKPRKERTTPEDDRVLSDLRAQWGNAVVKRADGKFFDRVTQNVWSASGERLAAP